MSTLNHLIEVAAGVLTMDYKNDQNICFTEHLYVYEMSGALKEGDLKTTNFSL